MDAQVASTPGRDGGGDHAAADLSAEPRLAMPGQWDYGATIPYEMPESLDDLKGPTVGTVRVGPSIDTTFDPVYDLEANPLDRPMLVERLLR